MTSCKTVKVCEKVVFLFGLCLGLHAFEDTAIDTTS